MSNIKSKQGTLKKKTIIIVSVVLVALVGLGTGLGVAFGGTSGKASDVINTDNNNGESYWTVTMEENPNDATKQIKTLRITKESKTEQHLKKAYNNMVNKNVDLTSFNELHLPYHLKDKVTEERAKELLHIENINNEDIGYILHKEDFVNSGNVLTGGYRDSKLVEVSLPEDIETLPNDAFHSNKIKKVNWSELTQLKSIGNGAFYRNKLNGDLDLSRLTSLSLLGERAFILNELKGSLTLPPNITTIGKRAFNSLGHPGVLNKIKGTLKLPKTLESIGFEAFVSNSIEVLDWSEAENLTYIEDSAFAINKIKTLQLNATILPKLKRIGQGAFLLNEGLNNDNEMLTNDFTLPTNLEKIGPGPIKVKNGITITKPSTATGITVDSFEGTPIIKPSS